MSAEILTKNNDIPFKACAAGLLSLVLLFTVFGYFFCFSHSISIAATMLELAANGVDPLVDPQSVYLQGAGHRLGSALFFGLSLGAGCAFACILYSFVPWLRGRFTRGDLPGLLLLVPVCLLMCFSRVRPILSVVFALLSPMVFFTVWSRYGLASPVRRISGRNVVILTIILCLPVVALAGTSFIQVRDLIIENPVTAGISDFYYDHTLLAADVIKKPVKMTQKLISIESTIPLVGGIPHGSLWVVSNEPCSVAGADMVIAPDDGGCRAYVPVTGENNVSMLAGAGDHFDLNANMRRGIGFSFMTYPLYLIALAGWIACGINRLAGRNRFLALVLIIAYFALFVPGLVTSFHNCVLKLYPEKIHSYVLSENAVKRYAAVSIFPERLSMFELVRYCSDTSPRVRLNALIEAGRRGDRRLNPTIIEALKDPQLNVRTKACRSLGMTGGTDAKAALFRVLESDESWYVREYAFRALGRIAPFARVTDKRGE